MDIQRFNFPWKLLEILVAVSESHFVSFDLELSGVPVRAYGAQNAGKQTLQQRYSEIKEAAEQYTILQLGLTCVKEDAIAGTYELKPFNIHLSPVLTERLDIDRTFSFHSGAVEFLNSVGFNFQAPMAIGVPYLSRDEAALARARTKERLSRTKDFYEPLVIKPEEVETLALQKRVQKLTREWLKTESSIHEGLYLGPKELSTASPPPEELSRFEKRIVHQIIRSDFEDLVTFPRRGAIQVQRLDKEREEHIKQQKLKESQERIHRQTGFRWIVEAIAGKDFSKIDWQSFIEINDDGHAIPAMFDVKSRFQQCQHRLRGKPRPVVGHNMFLDLVYLYQTFVGQLPDKVEEFAHAVNDLFPLVVDTKYVATHECGDLNPMSSLQQIAEQLDAQEKPVMHSHKDFGKYQDMVAHHEAGYDSLLTAKIAVRLSAKLEAERMPAKDDGEDDEPGGVSVGTNEPPSSRSVVSSAIETFRSKLVVPVAEAVAKVGSRQDHPSRFAHATAFDGLQEEGETSIEASNDPVLNFDDLPDSMTAADNAPQDWHEGRDWAAEQPWTPYRLMPRWSTEFWQEYGNRLRVFGTRESMCVLQAGTKTAAMQNKDGEPIVW
ncbi:Poly(A)-specific ribonuclease PARN [Sphaceloma murrayae]|uniref:Poly(A)-specific ribonuclease PARN n=1 Tax=Sphaceloma murrayae TaxID=2082308 RepID=A0A2K1QR73_9PEZI|nr:Poly(A)-specific ribonuclease PARN [Sphaceloma murrayae]